MSADSGSFFSNDDRAAEEGRVKELDVAPLYPSTLFERDAIPLWYLDLKDWIGLAKARLGRPGGERYDTGRCEKRIG